MLIMSRRPIHELAPTTRRSAKLLSRIYGFQTPEAFSQSLPDDAVVVDFGAGNSRFGAAIAELRPDIQWLNVDLRYGSGYPSKRARSAAPANLQYIGADVLSPCLRPASADRVLSNALLPHIAMTEEKLALDAIHNMGSLLKDDGEMMLGKRFTSWAFRAKPDGAVHITAGEFAADPLQCAEYALDQVRLPGSVEATQYVLNHVHAAYMAGKAALSDLTRD